MLTVVIIVGVAPFLSSPSLAPLPGERLRGARLNGTDWKDTSAGAEARAHVVGYLLGLHRLVDAGMDAEVGRYLATGRWRDGVDLTGVPEEVVRRTESLTRALHTHATDARALLGVLNQLLDLW